MTSLDPGLTKVRTTAGRLSEPWMRLGRWVHANGLDVRSMMLRLPGGERFLAGFDRDWSRLRNAAGHASTAWGRFWQFINTFMPKGLYARALLIIIAPMVILQSVVAFVFMDRHWNVVTQRLSAGVVQDIAALVDVYRGYPQEADQTQLRRIARERLALEVDFLPVSEMP